MAIVLALAGCGGDEDATNAAAANKAAALTQIPAPNGGDWTQAVSETPEGGYRMGNPDAPVKLVEYGSIGCPYCGRFSVEGSRPLAERYVHSGQVSWEFRPYLIHPEDPAIFQLLRCMGPGPFFRLTEQLYATQQEWAGRLQAGQQQFQNLPREQRMAAMIRVAGLDQFFRQRGMPQSRIDSCLADTPALERLADITSRAQSQGVGGTPNFWVNGEQTQADSWAEVEQRLRAAIGG